jgi:hypothetical protein
MGRYRSFGLFVFGGSLLTICGSAMGDRLGLHGLQQWPITGFGVGIVLFCYSGMSSISDRISKLEGRIAADSKQ